MNNHVLKPCPAERARFGKLDYAKNHILKTSLSNEQCLAPVEFPSWGEWGKKHSFKRRICLGRTPEFTDACWPNGRTAGIWGGGIIVGILRVFHQGWGSTFIVVPAHVQTCFLEIIRTVPNWETPPPLGNPHLDPPNYVYIYIYIYL